MSNAQLSARSLLTRLPVALLGLVGAGVLLYGVRQTWISTFAGLIDQSGWGTRNGDILVAGAIAAAAVAVAQVLFATTALRWLLAITGLAAAGFAGYLLIQLYTVTQQLDGMVLGQKGPGLYVAAVGGALIFLTLFLPMPASTPVADPEVAEDGGAEVTSSWLVGLRSRLRYLAAALAVVAGLAHVPVTPEHLRQAPYIGVLFMLVTVVCVLSASLLLIADSVVVWAVVTTTCLLAALAYVASRTVGLPLMADDVGNWFQTLGMVSVLAEAGVVILGGAVLRQVVSGQANRELAQQGRRVLTTE